MDSIHLKPVKLLAIILIALACGESVRHFPDPDTQATLTIDDLQIHVNQATEESLRLLPGIGTVTVARIIEERDRRPFADAQDFENRVKGIGPAFMMNYGQWINFDSSPDFPESRVQTADSTFKEQHQR